MTDIKQEEFDTLYFKITENIVTENKDTGVFKESNVQTVQPLLCKKINIDERLNTKGYLFTDDKITIYYGDTNDGTVENPINDDKWFIKLTIKTPPHMYVNFIRTPTERQEVYRNLNDLISIVKTITRSFNIHKIILEDASRFSCNNQNIISVHIRSLDRDKSINNISIYQKEGFKPIKNVNIESCITTLRSITCEDLYTVCLQTLKVLNTLNKLKSLKHPILRITIDHNTLDISYDTIRNTKMLNAPIINNYIRNFEQIKRLLEIQETRNVSIYEYYKNFCRVVEDEDCCRLRSEFLSCLENPVNSHVIIVEGVNQGVNQGVNEGVNQGVNEVFPQLPDTPCDLKIPYGGYEKYPIIITKLFNLFYGTFEKIKYIYFEMELDI